MIMFKKRFSFPFQGAHNCSHLKPGPHLRRRGGHYRHSQICLGSGFTGQTPKSYLHHCAFLPILQGRENELPDLVVFAMNILKKSGHSSDCNRPDWFRDSIRRFRFRSGCEFGAATRTYGGSPLRHLILAYLLFSRDHR